MTDRELLKQALEALEDVDAVPYERVHSITAALRERLAQPEAPVLTGVDCSCGRKWRIVNNTLTASEPVLAPPPRREWVGLTLEEIGLLTTGDGWSHLETPALALFARAIEAKLKEKNA